MDKAKLLIRFRNAQRRCLYWSGTPSFSTRRAKAEMSGKMDEKYELYMCDQRSLADCLRDFDIVVPVRDYKAEFRHRFSNLTYTPTTQTK